MCSFALLIKLSSSWPPHFQLLILQFFAPFCLGRAGWGKQGGYLAAGQPTTCSIINIVITCRKNLLQLQNQIFVCFFFFLRCCSVVWNTIEYSKTHENCKSYPTPAGFLYLNLSKSIEEREEIIYLIAFGDLTFCYSAHVFGSVCGYFLYAHGLSARGYFGMVTSNRKP